jgi:hypothetical protein
VRSAERAAEVGDVTLYFPEVEVLFKSCQALLHRARVDVAERDPLEDTLRRIQKYDNRGALRLVDSFPVATQQTARRQRNDTIAAVILREKVLQDLRPCDAKIMRRKVTVSKSLDRRFEETLDFDIQVEKAIFEKTGQSRAYGGLADS